MNSRRLIQTLSVLGLGIASACSLTVPSEDEVFGAGKSGSTSAGATNSSGAPGGGTSSDAGMGGMSSPADRAGSAGTMATSGGGAIGEGGTLGEGGADAGSDAGGAAGEPVVAPRGEIVNASFEEGLNGWTIDPSNLAVNSSVPGKPTVFAQGVPNVTPSDGNFALSTWDMSKPYTVRIYQVVKGLEDGTYKLTAQVANKIGVKRAEIYAKNCGGALPMPAAPPDTTALVEVTVDKIEVVGGSCEIGLDVDAAAADWVNADSFKLTKLPPPH